MLKILHEFKKPVFDSLGFIFLLIEQIRINWFLANVKNLTPELIATNQLISWCFLAFAFFIILILRVYNRQKHD